MASLIDFLRARIADDEQDAVSSIRIWEMNEAMRAASGFPSAASVSPVTVRAARRLLDCSARRRIIDSHADSGECLPCTSVALGPEACTTLRELAVQYADHPEYERAWFTA